MNCKNCGQETSNPKFCSRSCSTRASNLSSPKRPLTRVCARCPNIVMSSRSSLCITCNSIYGVKSKDIKNKTIGEYRNMMSVKGKHPSWLHAAIRGFAHTWLEHLTHEPCRNCGYTKHVELCHIKPISKFPDSALLKDVNAESNVMPLCRNCHWEMDDPLNYRGK